MSDLQHAMTALGEKAKQASQVLAIASAEQKNQALRVMAVALRKNAAKLMRANQKDLTAARQSGHDDAFLDRLTLTHSSIDTMASGLEAIANFPDPVGRVLAEWERPNGLHISRVSVPLGVVAVIYESRPNVTADAAALCLKSGNAVILRGGSDSFHSSGAIMQCLQQGLAEANLPTTCIQMVPSREREAVGLLLKMDDVIDVLIPRGGKSLIKRLSEESRIPLFKHLEGICHSYVHTSASCSMAIDILSNAKMRRPGICGATETILIDAAIKDKIIPDLLAQLSALNCQVRGDEAVLAYDSSLALASEEDWSTEYLAPIVSIRVVSDIHQAIAHINHYGSQHTDAIITDDENAAEQFLNEVSSAIVMCNASTQFADGGEFGMGAEIGIATGKLHARGPVGIEQLTTFKYQVRGSGQTRP